VKDGKIERKKKLISIFYNKFTLKLDILLNI